MLHCPFCGAKIKEEELFCTQCGKKIPNDIYERMPNKTFPKLTALIPVTLFILLIISTASFYLFLDHQEKKATEAFKSGEELALDREYTTALQAFESAIEYKSNFPSAHEMQDFMQTAIKIEAELSKAAEHKEQENYQEAIAIINDADLKLKNYDGDVVRLLVDDVIKLREETLIKQIKQKIENEPTIEQLKPILWEAEAIKNKESEIIAKEIRGQIESFTFAQASEQLKDKQFSDARSIVEDGLRYLPNSDKLQSLKTTIEKEKTAFETAAEKRIEQAMTAAEEERMMNSNDAVELTEINISTDDQENLVVSGSIKSIATVPISSISVEYVLLNNEDDQILSNEVYIHPDTMYPEEVGKFEFTHYDVKETKDLKVQIKKIKWFLD